KKIGRSGKPGGCLVRIGLFNHIYVIPGDGTVTPSFVGRGGAGIACGSVAFSSRRNCGVLCPPRRSLSSTAEPDPWTL
ncbi:hypothetical protein RYX56_23350, partial [Alkalihalophilus lindianensis]